MKKKYALDASSYQKKGYGRKTKSYEDRVWSKKTRTENFTKINLKKPYQDRHSGIMKKKKRTNMFKHNKY